MSSSAINSSIVTSDGDEDEGAGGSSNNSSSSCRRAGCGRTCEMAPHSSIDHGIDHTVDHDIGGAGGGDSGSGGGSGGGGSGGGGGGSGGGGVHMLLTCPPSFSKIDKIAADGNNQVEQTHCSPPSPVAPRLRASEMVELRNLRLQRLTGVEGQPLTVEDEKEEKKKKEEGDFDDMPSLTSFSSSRRSFMWDDGLSSDEDGAESDEEGWGVDTAVNEIFELFDQGYQGQQQQDVKVRGRILQLYVGCCFACSYGCEFFSWLHCLCVVSVFCVPFLALDRWVVSPPPSPHPKLPTPAIITSAFRTVPYYCYQQYAATLPFRPSCYCCWLYTIYYCNVVQPPNKRYSKRWRRGENIRWEMALYRMKYIRVKAISHLLFSALLQRLLGLLLRDCLLIQ